MIHFYRTASVQPGKLGEAIAHAKAIADHLETAHGYKVQVAVPFGGKIGQINYVLSASGRSGQVVCHETQSARGTE